MEGEHDPHDPSTLTRPQSTAATLLQSEDNIMSAKITREVLEGHLSCKSKGFLKLTGQQGTKSAYETLLTGLREEVRRRTTDQILTQHPGTEVERGIPLTLSALKRGASFILDATWEDDLLSLCFDGLKRVAGPSKLGDFHYIPLLFHGSRRISQEQRALLDLYGLLLSRLQGRTPSSGIVYHGQEGRATRVHLNRDPRRTEQLLRGLEQLRHNEAPPKLVLNDHCAVCEFRQHCHAQAVKEDNLSLLRGLGEKEVKRYARKGLLTLTQLAHTFRPRRKGKRVQQRNNRRYHALQALAIRDKRIYLLGTPNLPAGTVRIYLDVEGNPEEGTVYLIGLIVDNGGEQKRYSFWADDKDQEGQIFEQFLDVVAPYDDFQLFCYGSYERTFLKRMRGQVQKKKVADRVLKALVNTLSLVYAHVYFPTYSNSLKQVGSYLGCAWSETDASGTESIAWRMRWRATREETWKQKLVTYNLEDCVALKRVTEVVSAIAAHFGGGKQPPVSGIETLPVSPVQEVDKLTNDRKWGRIQFFHPEYEYINNCAYFDYQRERVYIRTSKVLRRSRPKKTASHNRRLRITKRVSITRSRCPSCGSKNVTVSARGEPVNCRKPRVKRAFDLVFTSGGIKRKVVECRTAVHRCLICGATFVPEQHQRLDKHFHGLKSWAMYQHVAHSLSLTTIQSMLEEFFGLRVFDSEIHMFKGLLARYYRVTYRGLLDKILAGNLLHVDETEVKLQAGKGYVWAFTNLEEVVFMYRPTREADFLHKLLKDFRGVLVSDFYAGYDALACPQQKCLIHLMRDMNQELLNNPYDEELQLVTRPFGTLLRAIVATVDAHGLKRSHLKRHEREVADYFQVLSGQLFRSEAAEALRKRLLKYQDKLFTFLHHDGVPWNNNNAENAIKRFAYYREDTDGTMREPGLKDFLVLLSVCHTCRYKGVSFLKFLLSRERVVDLFCERRRAKRRSPTIEVYPKGFIPPHFVNREKRKLDSNSQVAADQPSPEQTETPSPQPGGQ